MQHKVTITFDTDKQITNTTSDDLKTIEMMLGIIEMARLEMDTKRRIAQTTLLQKAMQEAQEQNQRAVAQARRIIEAG